MLGIAALTGSLAGILGAARLARIRARTLMIALNLTSATTLTLLAALTFTHHLTLTTLICAAAIESACTILFAGASASVLKHIAGPHLDQLNAHMEAYFWTIQAAGPVLGGTLTHFLGPALTITTNATSFIIASALLLKVPNTTPAQPNPHTNTRPELLGIHTIWHTPLLRRLFLNALIFTTAILGASALLPVFMRNTLHFDAWQFGIVHGLPCLGGLIAGLASAKLVQRYGRQRLLVTFGTARTFWLLPMAFVPVGFWAMPTMFLFDFLLLFCAGLFNPLYVTTRLRATPTHCTAAVISTWAALNRGITPLGIIAIGFIADHIGTRPALFIGGTLAMASALLLIKLPAPPDTRPDKKHLTPTEAQKVR